MTEERKTSPQSEQEQPQASWQDRASQPEQEPSAPEMPPFGPPPMPGFGAPGQAPMGAPGGEGKDMPQPGTNVARWDIEDTHPELVEDIRKGLRTVVDPELGVDVVTLGLVRNITIDNDEVKMTMILTTPFCPYGPALLEMARQKVEQIVGKPTTVEIGSEMWDVSMMEDGEILKQWGLWW